MALKDDSKNIAKKLGFNIPNDLDDDEQLEEIAHQVGFDDYQGTDEDDEILNKILRDMDAENSSFSQGYDPYFDENDMDDSFDDVGPGYGFRPYGSYGDKHKNVDESGVDKTSDLDKDEEANEEEERNSSDKDKSKDKQNNDNDVDNVSRAMVGPAAVNNALNEDSNNSANTQSAQSEKNPKESQVESTGKSDVTESSKAAPGPSSSPIGNGYTRGTNANSKRDELNRSRFDFNKRMQEGKALEDGDDKKVSKGVATGTGVAGSSLASGKSEGGSKLGNKGKGLFKGKAGNFLDKTAKTKEVLDNPFRMGTKALLNGLKHMLLTNPFVWCVIGFLLLFLIVLFVCLGANSDSSGSKKRNSGTQCSYNLKGVTASGDVSLDDVKVELVNCDATQSDYRVLETIDFEKYVLGVALAEIGPDSPDEAIKAQIIAARNFALTRNSGMCPGNPDNCFYGYNVTTKKIRMRACEADQVYWDYDKDIYRSDRGAISLYSPEVNSGSLWKSALSEQRKSEILALADSVKGKVLVDSSNNVYATSYNSSKSSEFISLANSGKSFDQILESVYGTGDFNSANCRSGSGNIDYGDYVLSSDGHQILHQDLSSFLNSKGTSLEEFNSLISKNVDKAGYGTRAGVVSAAVTLIAELGNNYQVKIPYYWGGGHESAINDFAKSNWGSTACHTYANNQSYNYCGLDCSGFVPWAIHNGGYNMSWARLAGEFQNISGAKRVSLSNVAVLEPGDLLESSGHIVLVVGIDESSSQYICAEASGNAVGVLFTRRPFSSSGYWGVKMDGYYENSANVRSK